MTSDTTLSSDEVKLRFIGWHKNVPMSEHSHIGSVVVLNEETGKFIVISISTNDPTSKIMLPNP